MTATVTDDRRRLVMPRELPAGSAVTIQEVEPGSWLIKRLFEDKNPPTQIRYHYAKLVKQDGRWIFLTPSPLEPKAIADAVAEERSSR